MNLLRTLDIPAAPVVAAAGALRPLGLEAVHIRDGFWGDRRTTNRTATLPHILFWLEREGWLPNFDLAARGGLPDGRRGREFSDSEVYKFLEAIAWQLGADPEDDLELTFRGVVDRVAAAQAPDGYLNTYFGRPGQAPRWSDLEWGHELYCLGHLFQAAVARHRVSPLADDGLVDIARRAADLVCDVFGPDGIEGICGHPEVETGLAELGRALEEPRYTQQAALFVDRRGQHLLPDIEWGRSYYQDDVPVRDATELRGHAVRANYLAAGAVDTALDTHDGDLLDALKNQWQRTVARRTYITGGQGSHHQDEAFGTDYELPADRAYSETCAGVGSIMFSWRLLLATGDEKYADLIERTLYNVIATSPATDGRSFYYSNTLHQRTEGIPAAPLEVSPRASASLRAPWFDVACCPPNVARTLASLPAYIATSTDEGLQIHQYAAGEIDAALPDGTPLRLRIETDYPTDGVIVIRVLADTNQPWTLRLRIPAWAEHATVAVTSNNQVVEQRSATPGATEVNRQFRAGDTITLTLPLQPRMTRPDPRIDAIRDCVAIERGPQVYCLESVDLPLTFARRGIDDICLAPHTAIADIDGALHVTVQDRPDPTDDWPYTSNSGSTLDTMALARLTPYHDWANRGPSTMRIWLPIT